MPGGGSDDKEDADFFRRAMSGVKPLHKGHTEKHPVKPRARIKSRTIDQEELRDRTLYKDLAHQAYAIDDTSSGSEVLFARPGLQRKVLRRLRRGEFAIEDHLDLHGLRALQAEQTLESFVRHALDQGFQSLLIVHGKGSRSQEKGGVIKPLTINWLKSVPQVLAFCSAVPRDGGTGAVYVLLKRSGT